jgi:hypothetical protein
MNMFYILSHLWFYLIHNWIDAKFLKWLMLNVNGIFDQIIDATAIVIICFNQFLHNK